MRVFGLEHCLPDNVVDHKLGDGRGAILLAKSCRDSYGVSCPSNPKLPVVSGIVPIAYLVLVWPTNGRDLSWIPFA